MPETPTMAGGSGQSFGLMVSLTVLVVAIVLIRILMLDEAASDRTQTLLLVVGSGAFCAALPTVALTRRFASQWNHVVVVTVGTVFFTALFVPTTLFCFALQNRLLEGHLEPGALDDGRFREIIFSLMGAMGLFLPTGMRYFLPWTLPMIMVGGFLLFYFWPTISDTARPHHHP